MLDFYSYGKLYDMSKKLKLYSNSYGKSKDISEKCLIFTVMENCKTFQKMFCFNH